MNCIHLRGNVTDLCVISGDYYYKNHLYAVSYWKESCIVLLLHLKKNKYEHSMLYFLRKYIVYLSYVYKFVQSINVWVVSAEYETRIWLSVWKTLIIIALWFFSGW